MTNLPRRKLLGSLGALAVLAVLKPSSARFLPSSVFWKSPTKGRRPTITLGPVTHTPALRAQFAAQLAKRRAARASRANAGSSRVLPA
jgi:hypothetical protein